jgi:hypothetical protein
MKKYQTLLIGSLFLFTTSTHAGFADSIRELRNTIGQLSDTTKEITGVTKEVGALSGSGSEQATSTQYSSGQTLYPKLNNVSLYESASKSAPVIKKLTKSTDLVFTGKAHKSGFIQVTTEYGDGWVESHLIR